MFRIRHRSGKLILILRGGKKLWAYGNGEISAVRGALSWRY
jgi:hypothetical protein